MSDEPLRDERADALARRVRWLDTYRRGIAIGIAFALAPLVTHQLSTLLGVDWPQFHVTLLAILTSVIAWWVVEVGLAWMTALWETEYDRIVRERGLPRAILRKKKRPA